MPKNYLLERQLNDTIEKLQAQQFPNQCCSQCYDQNEVDFEEIQTLTAQKLSQISIFSNFQRPMHSVLTVK